MSGNSYLYRKIHSLLGVIPLGFFLVEHMLTNYSAFQGGVEKFTERVLWLNSMPLIFFLELFGIWLPLLYHGVYGLYVAYQSRNNPKSYGYFRNWMFTLQRISGVITLVFVFWHVYNTRFQITLGNVSHETLGSHFHTIASNPIYFTIYVIAVIFATFHFTNGMWSFLVSWGVTVGPRAQRVSSVVWMGVFVVMTILFIMSLSAFTDPSFAAANDVVTLNFA